MQEKPASGRIATYIICLNLGILACKSNVSQKSNPNLGRTIYDTTNIDVDDFVKDKNTQRKILAMPWGEAVARLGALEFRASSTFIFSRGGREFAQNDTYTIQQDKSGNFYVRIANSAEQVETYLINDTFYVRYDKGQFRRRLRRDIEPDVWCDRAYSSLNAILEVFNGAFAFVEAKTEKQTAGSKRFDVRLSEDAERIPELNAKDTLPIFPRARWRELAKPLDLKGSTWVDAKAGVITKIEMEGRLEMNDREVRPTQMLVRYVGSITPLIQSVQPPAKSIPWIYRESPPKNPLHFFADSLPTTPANDPTAVR